MKNIIEKVIPATKIVIKSEEVWTCDICGKEHQTAPCASCGRDICVGTFSKCSLDDPDEMGDYPDRYCPICYNLKFKKYEPERRELAEKYYADDLAINAKIREESLLTKVNKVEVKNETN